MKQLFKPVTTQASRLPAMTALVAAALMAGHAQAQNAGAKEVQRLANVVQLSADGTVEVRQDWMTATLSVSKDGRDAAAVQAQLQKIVDAAMSVLRAEAQGGKLEFNSGNFSISPRYGSNSKIEGWQGQAEVVLQGRDFVRITQAAAKVPDMTLASMGFSLSREAREKVEGEAQAKAIENFRQRASAISKSFGFAGYSLREVAVNSSGSSVRPMPRPRMAAMSKSSYADAAPVAVEAGRAEVVVSVGGSIQMQ